MFNIGDTVKYKVIEHLDWFKARNPNIDPFNAVVLEVQDKETPGEGISFSKGGTFFYSEKFELVKNRPNRKVTIGELV